MNPNVGTAASRVRYFMRINPSEFYGSKVEKDPQEFIDEVTCYHGSDSGREGGIGRLPNQRFFGKGSSNAPPKFNKDRASNPKTQGGNGSGSSLPRSTCSKCGRKHESKCLASTDSCFGCGKSSHKMRDCPMLTAKGREVKQAPPSGLSSNAPKQNRFYALQTRSEEEGSTDVVTVLPYLL
ncbi:uncharacterized protein LOC125858984 [Solanum stenotomum]|uniref:uncharacterized protein LOC125858984 n=1 Tax=Solanum stenotomum TaxID=172797 RepID=UPI0020D1E2DC|nr:uncharacterized protein LOC125858984 [Solanum stenotomum]